MAFLSRIFPFLGSTSPGRQRPLSRSNSARPVLELLEDRCVPSGSGVTAIQSNFNGTPIAPGSTLWFTSVLKANGLGSGPVTLQFTNQTITFSANGAGQTVNVPDATITFNPAVTTATTSFDTTSNSWVTTLPMQFSGNGFLSAVAVPEPNGLPGGINPVTWQGTLQSNTTGVSINWQWAAAVYTNPNFGADYNALNVKPVDDNHVSQYQNSDHAGTPEAFTSFVTGGARGGGGSNFTGSMSATASVVSAADSSLSGFVFDVSTGVPVAESGVTVTLTEMTSTGQTVTIATTTTDASGYYKFLGLPAGSYTITETPPDNSVDDYNTVGTVGGISSLNDIYGINLGAGVNGMNYDFYNVSGGS